VNAAAARRLSSQLWAFRVEAATGTLVLCAAVAAAAFSIDSARSVRRDAVNRVTVELAPAQRAALVAATSGEQASLVRAVGEDARMINASMPFSKAPVQAAAAFVGASASALDYSRALLCLTQAVYYEAGFEPLAGRRAVAQVVLNRLRHPAFPKSICGVVYQRTATPVCQFTFVCDGSLTRAPAAGAWREAEDVAREALAGRVEADVGEATHYHADYVAPRWAPLLAKVARLGAHIFYRWPGAWGLRSAFTGRYIGEPYDPAALRPRVFAVRPGNGAPVPGAGDELVESGPPIARAPNDVGGLLDTSKGWTLNIPKPGEFESATAHALAEQHAPAPAAPAPASASASAAPPPVAPVAAAVAVSEGAASLVSN
jgi:spore germination cell wall hydrolase CwlJ-like protein